jgi:hypothetical protein
MDRLLDVIVIALSLAGAATMVAIVVKIARRGHDPNDPRGK